MTGSAVIFDLDGVISDTAALHATAWKIVFDSVLEQHYLPHSPFTLSVDYKEYVDGKSRQVGIECFLASRGIRLHQGNAGDDSLDTVYGIGNRKNNVFRGLLSENGAKFFDDATDLIQGLQANEVDLGIASSSKNAKFVLEQGRLTNYFKVIMDGLVAEECNVESKRSPEFFSHAASLLGLKASQCIAIDDAISGVTSAKEASIGFVIGVSRNGNPNELRDCGADLVVASLDELSIGSLRYGPGAMFEAPLSREYADIYG